jgi:hypothetical protein
MQMMTHRNIFLFASLAFSTFCLAAGYVLAGQWIGVMVALITGLTWLYARKNPALWLSHLCLLASVCLTMVGILAGGSPMLMLLGSGVALAVWDLVLLNNALKSSIFGGQTRRYENKHLQSLALAIGSGLLVALLGRWLHLEVPFVMLMLFVALVIFGLDRIWSYIKIADYR